MNNNDGQRGVGRPSLSGKKMSSKVYHFRVTDEQRKKIDSLGGATWLRQIVEATPLPWANRVRETTLSPASQDA